MTRRSDWQFSLAALIALVTTIAVCLAAVRWMGIYVVIFLGPPFLVATFVATFMLSTLVCVLLLIWKSFAGELSWLWKGLLGE
jgi:hypothetical protein